MPRGGRGSGGRSRSPSPMRAAPRRSSPPPSQQRAAPPPPTKAPVPAAPQPAAVGQPVSPGGGMMANIASTAAGVAIGHTIGHAITGSFSGSGGEAAEGGQQTGAAAPLPTEQGNYQRPIGGGYCEQEFQQFVRCTQEQSDISLCSGYNEILKECKLRNMV